MFGGMDKMCSQEGSVWRSGKRGNRCVVYTMVLSGSPVVDINMFFIWSQVWYVEMFLVYPGGKQLRERARDVC